MKRKILKKWQLVLFIIIAVSFAVLKAFDVLYWSKGEVRIGDQTIKVLIADRPTHRYKGWSNRNSMGNYEGMWFKFASVGYQAMVMREMKFPLDIIWINNGEIVDIAPNLQPEPNMPENQLTIYRPRLPASDVLEVRAGFTEENELKIGDIVELIRY